MAYKFENKEIKQALFTYTMIVYQILNHLQKTTRTNTWIWQGYKTQVIKEIYYNLYTNKEQLETK